MPWELVLKAILGACIGSFLNVVALRYDREDSFIGRSRCPACLAQLSWWELVPIVSFLILRGRCHSCSEKISWQYPLVEVAAAAAWVWAPNVAAALILSVFIVLFLVDLRLMILPDIYIVVLTALVLARISSPTDAFWGGLLGAGLLLGLWAITRGRGLGFGDVKLMLPLGMLFGPAGTLVLLFLAFTVGGAVAVYLLLTKRATLKTAVPFGPYLLAAAAVLLVFPNLTYTIWI